MEPRPISVSVTLASSGRASQPFDPSTMLVSVDLSEIGAGTNRLAITESNIEVPRGWELYRVEPAEVVVGPVPATAVVRPIDPPSRSSSVRRLKDRER